LKIKKEVDGGKLAAGNCEKLKARADEVDQHAGKINAFRLVTACCLSITIISVSPTQFLLLQLSSHSII